MREDGDDLAMQVDPAAHRAHSDRTKEDGREVEDEQTLRGWLRDRLSRQGRPGPVAQN
jgi:hypothetical protein